MTACHGGGKPGSAQFTRTLFLPPGSHDLVFESDVICSLELFSSYSGVSYSDVNALYPCFPLHQERRAPPEQSHTFLSRSIDYRSWPNLGQHRDKKQTALSTMKGQWHLWVGPNLATFLGLHPVLSEMKFRENHPASVFIWWQRLSWDVLLCFFKVCLARSSHSKFFLSREVLPMHIGLPGVCLSLRTARVQMSFMWHFFNV